MTIFPWSDPAHVNTDLDAGATLGPWSDPAHEEPSPLSAAIVAPWSDPAHVDTLDAGQTEWAIATPSGLIDGWLYSATP